MHLWCPGGVSGCASAAPWVCSPLPKKVVVHMPDSWLPDEYLQTCQQADDATQAAADHAWKLAVHMLRQVFGTHISHIGFVTTDSWFTACEVIVDGNMSHTEWAPLTAVADRTVRPVAGRLGSRLPAQVRDQAQMVGTSGYLIELPHVPDAGDGNPMVELWVPAADGTPTDIAWEDPMETLTVQLLPDSHLSFDEDDDESYWAVQKQASETWLLTYGGACAPAGWVRMSAADLIARTAVWGTPTDDTQHVAA